MSTIIGIETRDGHVVLAGDSRVSSDTRYSDTATKVWRSDSGVIFGFAGAARRSDIVRVATGHLRPYHPQDQSAWFYVYDEVVRTLHNQLHDHFSLTDRDGMHSFDGEILIGVGDRLFRVGNDFAIVEWGHRFGVIGTENAIGISLGALSVRLRSCRDNLPNDVETAERIARDVMCVVMQFDSAVGGAIDVVHT